MSSKKGAKKPGGTYALPAQADPLPAQGAPTPPVGFKPPEKGQLPHLEMPAHEQTVDAPNMAQELSTSPTYVQDFGNRAPAAQALAAALKLAKGWTDEVGAAEQWLTYAKIQCEAAWRGAFALTKPFKKEFDLAEEHDANIAKRYPETYDFFHVKKTIAQRGAETRRDNKKAVKAKTA